MIDRLQAWFSACVREAVKSLPYAGEYRYSVVSCDFAAQTLDAKPLDPGQPNHTRVPMRAPGMRLDVAPGSEVLIGYAALDPTRPEVRAYSQQPGAILRVELLGGTTPVALQGMAVQVTIPASTVLVASPAPPGFVPNPAPIPLDGTIVEGSATIKGTS